MVKASLVSKYFATVHVKPSVINGVLGQNRPIYQYKPRLIDLFNISKSTVLEHCRQLSLSLQTLHGSHPPFLH